MEILDGRAVRAVTFDAGDTLVHLWVPKPERFGHLCRLAGVNLPSPAAGRAAAQACELVWQRRPDGKRDRQWWTEHNIAGLRAAGVDGDIEVMADHIYEVMEGLPPTWALEEGTVDVLSQLHQQGYRLSVVSNWDGTLDSVLDSLGIRNRFAFIADSAVLGYRKPDPRLHHAACEALGVRPAECLHIGDSINTDGRMVEASGAGFVLYDPLQVFKTHSNRISRLVDLLTLF